MAKNYTFAETVKIIAEGKDKEAIMDIGKRFPLMAMKIAAAAATTQGKEFVDLASYIPSYVTANKVNSCVKSSITDGSEPDEATGDSDETEEVETEEDSGTEDSGERKYEDMTGKELWDILGKAGARKTAKSHKVVDLIAAVKALDEKNAGKAEDKPKASKGKAKESKNEEPAEEDVRESPYDGENAMDLFKECKSRGISVAPKKPAKFYADLLMKDDASKKDEPEEADDWGDEEEEEKPAAKGKADKAKNKPVAKSEEEDEDWDI